MSAFSSTHFRLHQLADGVFAAIHAEGGWAQSNAGIVDLGDRVIIFDAFISPQAATDLRSAVASLLSRPIAAVINSHYHNDHIWGNQAFPSEVPIIATRKTCEFVNTLGVEEHRWFQAHSQERLSTLEAQLELEQDEGGRRLTAYSVAYYRANLAALSQLEIREPNLTFTDQVDFIGPKRVAHLICYGGGHTGSDSILYLPQERIIFMADLLFVGTHFYLPDGDPDEVRRTLARIMQLPATTLVPGHGRIGNANDVDCMLGYLDRLEALVENAARQNIGDEAVTQLPMPGEYGEWFFPAFFPANLKFLYRFRSRSSHSGGVSGA
jgi:cyclase